MVKLLSFDKFVHASIFFTLTFLWLLVGVKKNKLSLSFMIFIINATKGNMVLGWKYKQQFLVGAVVIGFDLLLIVLDALDGLVV
ncbi:MAG: hypothetical protein IPH32_14885 [Bacteroidetes bacterium]|nr:hypothetical protein [Bacteroidota bacterium]